MSKFEHMGVLLDCSRNAVMTVDSVKKLIDDLSMMGYNRLMLYMEDTYEVKDEPYFGYFRGRYSAKELKEIDDYGFSKNVEIIPCIQTLAHFTTMLRQKHYRDIKDIDDILLVGADKTYELIDKMISSLRDCFRTDIIHIGMDEAHNLGRGKYTDINGAKDKEEILLSHLNKVCSIVKKYNFKPMIWSDMFYRIATKGDYYAHDIEFDKNVIDLIPENLTLVYWDYYHTGKSHFDNMFSSHKKLSDDIGFAAGAWRWNGIVPHNELSITASKNAFISAAEYGVKDVYVTLWGDDGGEASTYSVLPVLASCACYNKGIFDENEIKREFKNWFDVDYDYFMMLDLPDKSDDFPISYVINPARYLLYNDCFLGKYDAYLKEGYSNKVKDIANKISDIIPKTQRFEYVFNTVEKLCRVLEIKAEIGVKTRKAYLAKDKAEIKAIICEYKEMISRTNELYSAVKKQWFKENKGNGFETQDIRFGGLVRRMESCCERLQMFYDGDIDFIEELEESVLSDGKSETIGYLWREIVTNNLI